MNRAIKYRIYPSKSQEVLILKTIGCSRFVYNHMLEVSKSAYTEGKNICSRNKFNYLLTDLKTKYEWLNEVDATALTSANDNLADAFRNFFQKRAKYPKFRKKHSLGTYTSKKIKVSNNIAVNKNSVRLPKLGIIKAKIHKMPDSNWLIKSATVSQESDGKFYVSVLFEFEKPVTTVAVSGNAVGLDYSSKHLYVDSNGDFGAEHKFYKEGEARLAKMQRSLSRKVGSGKGETKSHNYLKQLRKVNKLHRHIANQRLDHLHKKSTEIANQYDIVCVEDINMVEISKLNFGSKKSSLGKPTYDNGYGMFRNFLEYKLKERGKYFVKVGKAYPSSEICHSCGKIHPEMKDLSRRKLKCSCGLEIDRDVNAAINIKREGLRLLKEVAA